MNAMRNVLRVQQRVSSVHSPKTLRCTLSALKPVTAELSLRLCVI